MYELMEGLGKEGEGEGDSGNEKFCINLNLLGRLGLGMIESGKD